jgi:amino acid adenylation domain-containing protein
MLRRVIRLERECAVAVAPAGGGRGERRRRGVQDDLRVGVGVTRPQSAEPAADGSAGAGADGGATGGDILWKSVSVVVDAVGRHALWPIRRPAPAGWRVAVPATDRTRAIGFVERSWQDMTPPRGRASWSGSVPDRLGALAAADPDAPAILMADGAAVSRGALDREAGRVARAVAAAGAGREAIVAVALGRGAAAIAAFLGVMRAGAAFLPIDPSHPPDRIAFLIEDSRARLVVGDVQARGRLPIPAGAAFVDVDALPEPTPARPTIAPSDLAYVVYTSGSTGRPKGVAVEHGPLAMHVETTGAVYEMGPASRELHFLSFAFDGAHERWMVPLAAGGSIVLRGDELWTAAETLAVIRRFSVTHAGFPTSYMAELANWAEAIGDVPAVCCYSFGGEAMPRAIFDRVGRALRPRFLINGYGPTETVISPMVWKVAPGAAFAEPYAPIGSPVGERAAYVLGPDLEPVADGEAGELWLGGSGVARGYLHRPGLTAERFLPDPFSPAGGRMYRTGDIVRRRPDGSFAYVGREDGQVKIRGLRIELGEVEARLAAIPTVGSAVVATQAGPTGPRLVGYVTPAPGRVPEPGRLRAELARVLPAAAVPSRIIVLDELPLTPNGKIDRSGLPEPSHDGPPPLPPRSGTERRVAGLFAEALGLEAAGVNQPFFDLGGDSLSALRLLGRLRLAFPRRRIGIADLLGNPTIADLAGRLDLDGCIDGGAPGAAVVHLAQGGGRPPLILFPGLLVSLREYEPLVRRLGPGQPAFGFVCASLSGEPKPLPPVAALAADYAAAIAARVGGEGCMLLGWSWGGVLAFETARHLAGRVPVHAVLMADACGLEPPFAPGAEAPARPGERAALAAATESWLGQSRMRGHWEALRPRMDEATELQFLRFLAAEPQPLPTDGPDLGSRERILHALVDHALLFRALSLAPLDVPIVSFVAERSRAEGKPVIDWRGLSPRAVAEVVPETDHLDIVLSPAFHDRVREVLQAAARPAAAA